METFLTLFFRFIIYCNVELISPSAIAFSFQWCILSASRIRIQRKLKKLALLKNV